MNQPQSETSSGRWRPRFGLTTLLLVMLVFCLGGTAGYYLTGAMVGGGAPAVSPRATFALFTIAAPALLLLILSASRALLHWMQHRTKPANTRQPPGENTDA